MCLFCAISIEFVSTVESVLKRTAFFVTVTTNINTEYSNRFLCKNLYLFYKFIIIIFYSNNLFVLNLLLNILGFDICFYSFCR